MSPTAAVTGASGHLGSALVRVLLDRGWHVRALVHRRAEPIQGLDVEFVPGSVLAPESLRRLCRGADVVFHLAADIQLDPDAGAESARMFRVNVEGTRQVLRAVGACRVVHFGSVEVFLAPGVERVDEGASIRVQDGFTAYGRSKALAQVLVDRAAARGQDIVSVHPTAVLGPHDNGPSLLGRALMLLARYPFLPLPEGRFDFVDVRDVALGALAAAERGTAGAHYFLAGHPGGLLDLARMVDSTLCRRSFRMGLPVDFVSSLSPLFGLWNRLSGVELVCEESLRLLGGRFQVDARRTREHLGLPEPRPLEVTVRDALQWFHAHGLLGRQGPLNPQAYMQPSFS